MKSGKWRISVIVLAVVAMVGSAAGGAVADTAQTQNPPVSTMYQEFLVKLASNLGVSQDTVTSALKTTEQEMVSEAVYQGKLTQEQADKIESQPNFGMLGLGFLGGPHGGGGPGRGPGRGPAVNLDNIATVLGLSSSQLKTDMRSGKTLKQIVVDQGMTLAQFKQDIAQEVSSGKLTQNQANQILQQMDQTFSGPPPGGPPLQAQSNTTQSK